MIKAILFDAAGTLIHLPRGVGWHYRHIASRHGLHLDEERLGAAFAETFHTAGARVKGGIASPDDDKGWWRALVRRVLAACGQQPPDTLFDPFFEELYAHFAEPGVWALYPDALPVLETLHPRYRLAIVSNFDRRLYRILDHLGIRHSFGSIVISSELGFDKPDPRIFAAALGALGISPAEALHAGDHPIQDWQAAAAAGLHTFQVDRPRQTLEGLPDYLRVLEAKPHSGFV